MRKNPSKFNGSGESTDTEDWVKTMEKIHKLLKSTQQKKMICMLYQLMKGTIVVRRVLKDYDRRVNLEFHMG